MMYPTVYRGGSNASINSSAKRRPALRSEGFNADQCCVADDLMHVLGICGERCAF